MSLNMCIAMSCNAIFEFHTLLDAIDVRDRFHTGKTWHLIYNEGKMMRFFNGVSLTNVGRLIALP